MVMKSRKLKSLLLVLLCACAGLGLRAQCSSLYTTPEFPIATHPSDQHTQSWGTNIFTPTQFGTAAVSITGIQIYVDNSFGATTYGTQTIYMRHTAVSSYPNANYPTTAGFTQVFSGTYSFPMSGLYTIPFNVAAFPYNGSSNVEVLFENRSNVYRVNEPWFRRTQTYGAGVFRSKWNGNFGFGGFPGTASDGSAVRLTYTLSLTAVGGIGCGAILPVALRYLGAEPTEGGVAIQWEVASGSTATRIQVERSSDGSTFAPLVEAQGDHALDPAPLPGMNFYRLRLRDQDGLESLSGTVSVDYTAARDHHAYLSADPNGDLKVQLLSLTRQDAAVEVFDLHGRRLFQSRVQLQAGRNAIPLALHAPAGTLVVRVHGDTQSWVGKSALLD
jgi:hypothetical protein